MSKPTMQPDTGENADHKLQSETPPVVQTTEETGKQDMVQTTEEAGKQDVVQTTEEAGKQDNQQVVPVAHCSKEQPGSIEPEKVLQKNNDKPDDPLSGAQLVEFDESWFRFYDFAYSSDEWEDDNVYDRDGDDCVEDAEELQSVSFSYVTVKDVLQRKKKNEKPKKD